MALYEWVSETYRDISKTLCGIYLSNWDTATQPCIWEDYKLQVIITVATENHNPTTLADMKYLGISHHFFALADEPDAPLKQYLTETYTLLDEAVRNRKRILVHCRAGISRSAAVVLAYFMRRFDYQDLERAHVDLCTFRPVVGVNHGFRTQIIDWMKETTNKQESGAPGTPKAH